ncbi:hypothetical protein Tco_0083331, partial [Tanacetum coccineum]
GVTRFVIVREAARRTGRCSDTFFTEAQDVKLSSSNEQRERERNNGSIY